MGWRKCLACILAAAGLLFAPAGSAAAPFGFVGVNAEDVFAGDDAYQNHALGLMAANGISEIRQIWRWAYVEPIQGQLDWSALDRLTLNAARHGIRVLPLIGGETDWATSRPLGNLERCLFPPRDNRSFSYWATQVAARYGPNGHLWRTHPEVPPLPLSRYEVWNEPNLDQFWACSRSATAYVDLARQAANAIHGYDSSAEIISGGAPSKSGQSYLRAMFKAGARKVFDAFALHSYEEDANAVLAQVRQARDLLDDLGASSWKIHLTEFGWATGGPPSDHTVSEAQQAKLAKRTFIELGEQRKRLKIASADWYAWSDVLPPTDFGGGPDYWGLHTGLLRLDGTAKPALNAVWQASRAIK